MRINARLDESHSEKLRYLTTITKGTISDVLKRAIDLYYERARTETGNASSILQSTGFVGSGESTADLSRKYKEILAKDLGSKHDHR